MNSKTCILDIKVLLNKKQYINIEMQIVKQSYWKELSLTYFCRTYNNLDEGQDYADALSALQISILDKHTIAEKTGLSLTEIEALEKEQIS